MAINDNVVLLFLSAVASVFRAGALSALGSILQSAAIAAAHTREGGRRLIVYGGRTAGRWGAAGRRAGQPGGW